MFGLVLEGSEDILNVVELYAVIREYLLVKIILNKLGPELSEKARYSLIFLANDLEGEIMYRSSNGLIEAISLDMAIHQFDRVKQSEAKTKVEA